MSKGVRSAIFREAGGLRDEFTRHLSHIWALGEQQQKELLDSLPEVFQARTGVDRAIAQAKAVEAVGGDSRKILEAINVLNYLYVKWDCYKDKAEDVLAEMQELGFLPRDRGKAGAERFLQQFFAFLEQDSARRRRNSAAMDFLPSIVGLSAAVEHRAIFPAIFDWSHDDHSEYAPSCQGHVAVAIIKIATTEKSKPLTFQCDLDDLYMMINRLQALVREFEASEERLKSTE